MLLVNFKTVIKPINLCIFDQFTVSVGLINSICLNKINDVFLTFGFKKKYSELHLLCL